MTYRKYKNILVEKHKVIYLVIPKNACTSIKSQIVEILGLEKGQNYPQDIHDPKVYLYPYVKTEELNNEYHNYFKFCIARNPWVRLVSCYNDKIRSVDFKSEGYKNGVALPLMMNSPLFYGGMPFEEFVDVVCKIPDALGEHHFTSQLYQITDSKGNLLVNYIGNLENLNADLKEISAKTGFPINKFPHFHRTNKDSYLEYYTEELIEKVRTRYRADISFFNYEFENPECLTKIGYIDDALRASMLNSNWMGNLLNNNIKAFQNTNKNLMPPSRIIHHNNHLKLGKQSYKSRRNSFLLKISKLWSTLETILKLKPKS